jgi:hypothetical protein
MADKKFIHFVPLSTYSRTVAFLQAERASHAKAINDIDSILEGFNDAALATEQHVLAEQQAAVAAQVAEDEAGA